MNQLNFMFTQFNCLLFYVHLMGSPTYVFLSYFPYHVAINVSTNLPIRWHIGSWDYCLQSCKRGIANHHYIIHITQTNNPAGFVSCSLILLVKAP